MGGLQHEKPQAHSSYLLKVRLPGQAWDAEVDETVWVDRIAVGRAKLLNVPFFAYGASYNDVLMIEELNGDAEGRGITIRSGHSTYRIFVQPNQAESDFNVYWGVLEDLGCSYERASKHFYAVDVPPKADIYKVYRALEVGEEKGFWEFEEGHCGHNLPI